MVWDDIFCPDESRRRDEKQKGKGVAKMFLIKFLSIIIDMSAYVLSTRTELHVHVHLWERMGSTDLGIEKKSFVFASGPVLLNFKKLLEYDYIVKAWWKHALRQAQATGGSWQEAEKLLQQF